MNTDFLKIQNKSISTKLARSLLKNIKNSDFILGENVKILEKKLSKIVGSKYCCTVSSGTDALLIALKSIGLKKNEEVITSPFSWLSAVEMIVAEGAKPVFCDIDPLTFNINPNEITKLINKKTRAIIPISLFGQICDISKINKIAKKYKLKVIEDAAQSFGSKQENINSCNCADISTTSFFPTKPLGTLGDGGACFTNSDIYYKKFLRLRNHGQLKKGDFSTVGMNSRFDAIKAGFLLEKIKLFNKELLLRQKIYKNYCNLINNSSIDVQLPFIKPKTISVFAQFPLLTSERNRRKIQEFNKLSKKIKFPIFYKEPIYNLKPYKIYFQKHLLVTEKICKTIFCLPFHPYMNLNDQKKIIYQLKNIIKK